MMARVRDVVYLEGPNFCDKNEIDNGLKSYRGKFVEILRVHETTKKSVLFSRSRIL